MMTLANIVKSLLICVIIAGTMLLNVEDNLLSRMGLMDNYALLSVLVLLITIMATGINTFLTAVIIIFSVNTNMPTDFALNFGIDRDIYALGMLILLLASFSWTMVFSRKDNSHKDSLTNISEAAREAAQARNSGSGRDSTLVPA